MHAADDPRPSFDGPMADPTADDLERMHRQVAVWLEVADMLHLCTDRHVVERVGRYGRPPGDRVQR
jgi:hypothetical protein